jgi:drug/metabolite transporter (DMT)-like permease
VNSYLLIAGAAVLWALIGLLSRGILDAGVTPLEIAFWRALLAGGFFVMHAVLTGKLRLQRPRDAVTFAGFAAVGVVLFFSALTYAIAAGGVSLAFILLYTAPVFVVLLAWLLLGESVTLRKLLLTAVTLAGVVLVAQAGSGGVRVSAAALTWGLLAGLSYSSYYIFGKRLLARYAPVTIYAFIMPLGALGLLPFVRFVPKTPVVWLLLLLLAFVSTYLAYLLYYTGLKHAQASRAVLVATLEPVVALLLAAVVIGERLGAAGMTGSVLVLAGALLSALPARPRVPAAAR